MTVECYAQRLLNPFRGVMQTIRYASAEAVSLDGVHWDIYVANDALLEGLQVNRWTQITDIRYGSWSVEAGLKRGPLYPSDDFLRLEEMGATVYRHLMQMHHKVPFPLRDKYELWLLDGAGLPLALLSSVVREADMDLDQALIWRAGYAAEELFSSAAMQEIESNACAAAYLTAYIAACAGGEPSAQWFFRDEAGRGVGLSSTRKSTRHQGRELGATAFPGFFLRTHGHDAVHTRLIADYHDWLAPCLLSLSDLDRQTRRILEQQARQQALLLAKHHRLYPDIIDQALINAALVEAMMRHHQSTAAPVAETAQSTFYIELHPSPGGDRSI